MATRPPETPQLFEFEKPDADPIVLIQPVGSIIKTSEGTWGKATATYDESERYRYRVSRTWGREKAKRVCWIMLNPSTATEEVTDPTVERTLRFARAWGFGASEVVNIFALRSTDPKALYSTDDPIGPGNDEAIIAAGQAADLVICAWGVHSELGDRGTTVKALLIQAGVELHYMKLTKNGHPGHPLYLPAVTVATPWL